MNILGDGIRGLSSILFMVSMSAHLSWAGVVSPNPMQWHKTTVTFQGPSVSESGTVNPFRDYRLDVTFTGPSQQEYVVPGFYAADGDAGKSGAQSGAVWQVNFTPDEPGEWSYGVTFLKGSDVALGKAGTPGKFFNLETGTFSVAITDKKSGGIDFRGKGKLVYTGDHHLKFAGSNTAFMKAGANSPEVFLEYKDFDNTSSSRAYADHVKDWKTGDPTWGTGKGKGIIGAINYLSSLGVNALYFLTMNHEGDGGDAWPWISTNKVDRYDCSKLAQWDMVFEHMDRMGLMIHFVLTETENEAFFEIKESGDRSGFADLRKLYYREMVARFGYHLAITWNVGEENGWDEGSGYHQPNSDSQRKLFSTYLRGLTYYNDHIVVHNGPSTDDHILPPLYGHSAFTGPSLQWNYDADIHAETLKLRNGSIAAGHPWVVSIDEPWTSPVKNDLTTWRKGIVWGNIMAGGAGAELYIGGGVDITEQNYRNYQEYYTIASIAAQFMMDHVGFDVMKPGDSFINNGWALKKKGQEYLLYLPNGGSPSVTLPAGTYTIRWFNPRIGGALQKGSKTQIAGGSAQSIGAAPATTGQDWVVRIRLKVTPEMSSSESTESSEIEVVSDGAYKEEGGLVVIEAESAQLSGKWQQESALAGYTGEGYIVYRTDATNFDPSLESAQVTYPFYISTPGEYRIKIRNYIPNDDMTEMNDMFLKVDGNTSWKSFSHTTWAWNWEFMHDDGDENFFEPDYSFTEGEHQLTIIGRSDGFALDRIQIYQTDSYTPQEDLPVSLRVDAEETNVSSSDTNENGVSSSSSDTNENTLSSMSGVTDPTVSSSTIENFVSSSDTFDENGGESTADIQEITASSITDWLSGRTYLTNSIATLRIVDVTGKVQGGSATTENVLSESASRRLASLSPGIYFIQVTTHKGAVVLLPYSHR
ncbi:MAG: DUF5060 domain-containing protein [Fibrobacterales bacterium]